jgi:hypothetical protein
MAMSDVVLRPLSKGEILDGAFALFRRNFVAFVGSAAVFMVPACILALLLPKVGVFFQWLAIACAWGASVRVAADAVMGIPPAIARACGTGVRSLLPIALNYLGMGVAVGIVPLLLFLTGSAIAIEISVILVAGSMILLGITGFALMQVIMIENRWIGYFRSRVLAKQSWGKISVLMFLSSILTALPSMALLGMASVFSSDPAALFTDPKATNSVWMIIAAALLACFTTPFSQSVLTLLYFDQRVRKEGFGIELQAAALTPAAPKAG